MGSKVTNKNRNRVDLLLLLKQFPQRGNVALSHLKRFVLGELSVVAESGHNVAKTVEGAVQVVHPPAFTSVGRQTTFLHHLRSDFLQWPFVAVGSAAGAPRKRRL